MHGSVIWRTPRDGAGSVSSPLTFCWRPRPASDDDAPRLQPEVREQPPHLREPCADGVWPSKLAAERVLARKREQRVRSKLGNELVELTGADQPIGVTDLPTAGIDGVRRPDRASPPRPGSLGGYLTAPCPPRFVSSTDAAAGVNPP